MLLLSTYTCSFSQLAVCSLYTRRSTLYFLQNMRHAVQDHCQVKDDMSPNLDTMIRNLCSAALMKVPSLEGLFRSSNEAAKVQSNFQQNLLQLQLSLADRVTMRTSSQ